MSSPTSLLRRLLTSPSELCEALLNAPRSVGDVNSDGENTILAACLGDYPSNLVKTLILHGMSPYQTSKNGLCAAGIMFINDARQWQNIQPQGEWSELLARAYSKNGGFHRELLSSLPAAFGLHRAAALGLVDEIERLANDGVPIDCRDAWGFTPLLFALAHGRTDAVLKLLELGANADLKQGSEGLSLAAIVLPILEHLPKDFQDQISGTLILAPGETLTSYQANITIHRAAATNNVEVVEKLLNMGVPVNCLSLSGATPLDTAERNYAVDTAAFLRKSGGELSENAPAEAYPMLSLEHYLPKPSSSNPQPQTHRAADEPQEPLTPQDPHELSGEQHSEPPQMKEASLDEACRAIWYDNLHAFMQELDRGLDPNTCLTTGVPLLCEAAAWRRAHMVSALLLRGADPRQQTRQGQNALEVARRLSRNDQVIDLLIRAMKNEPTNVHESEPDIDIDFNIDALFNAIADNNPSVLTHALQNGLNPNARNTAGTPLLCEAAAQNRPAIVHLLIIAGADVNAKRRDGLNALACALTYGADAALMELLKNQLKLRKAASHGAENSHHVENETPAPEKELNNSTSEAEACSADNPHLVEKGDEAPALVNDPKLVAEAFSAIWNNDVARLIELLKCGLDPNSQSKQGYRLLAAAVGSKRIACIKQLLAAGADPQAQSVNGMSVIRYASMMPQNEEVLTLLNAAIQQCSLGDSSPTKEIKPENGVYSTRKLLEDAFDALLRNDREKFATSLRAGIDPNSRTDNGVPFLSVAAHLRRVAAVRGLLDAGADPEAISDDGLSVLDYARKTSYNTLVEKLISEAILAKQSIRRDKGAADAKAAFEAVWAKDVQALKEALNSGISPDVRSKKGVPLISEAINSNNLEAVELLISKGADPTLRDPASRSVLSYAERSMLHEAMTELILKAIASKNAPKNAHPQSEPVQTEPRETAPAEESARASQEVPKDSKKDQNDAPKFAECSVEDVDEDYWDEIPLPGDPFAHGSNERPEEDPDFKIPELSKDDGPYHIFGDSVHDRKARPSEQHKRIGTLGGIDLENIKSDEDEPEINDLPEDLEDDFTLYHKAVNAIWRNNLEDFAAALDSGLNPNCKSTSGMPLISEAASWGRLEMVRMLLRTSADPEAPSARGITPVAFAKVKPGNDAVVEVLQRAIEERRSAIKRGLDQYAAYNISQLEQAAFAVVRSGDFGAFRALMSRGVNPNCRSDQTKRPLLSEAAFYGRVRMVQMLLQMGADPKAQDASGVTPLEFANKRFDNELTCRVIARAIFNSERPELRKHQSSAAVRNSAAKIEKPNVVHSPKSAELLATHTPEQPDLPGYQQAEQDARISDPEKPSAAAPEKTPVFAAEAEVREKAPEQPEALEPSASAPEAPVPELDVQTVGAPEQRALPESQLVDQDARTNDPEKPSVETPKDAPEQHRAQRDNARKDIVRIPAVTCKSNFEQSESPKAKPTRKRSAFEPLNYMLPKEPMTVFKAIHRFISSLLRVGKSESPASPLEPYQVSFTKVGCEWPEIKARIAELPIDEEVLDAFFYLQNISSPSDIDKQTNRDVYVDNLATFRALKLFADDAYAAISTRKN